MAEKRRYLDFYLLIERGEGAFRAKVIKSPGGAAVSEFQKPFEDMEVDNFVLRMGRKRGAATRRMDSPQMRTAKEFGGRLFNAVFNGDVRDCLGKSLEHARQQELGLRIRLSMANAQELAELPWEYLYNSNLNRFLALSNETPLVRYLDLAESIRPLAVKPPIRILAMISSPEGEEKLEVEEEKTKLRDALGELERRGLVEIDVLEQATLPLLQLRLRENEYHIFHFIGHGGFEKETEEGLLMLEEEDKSSRRVTAQYLGALLHDERTLRLAVLNACEGARTSKCDPFAGTAQTLVQQGIPAVIAMQFDVSDEAAIAFTQEFYRAIAVGYPVDAALAEGRKAIYAQVNEIEWGTPVLYMRAPDGNIFDVTEVDQVELLNSRIEAMVREGEQFLVSEDWAKAVEKLQAALAIDEKNDQVRQKLTKALQYQQLALLYAKGRVAYDAGQWAEALEHFRQIQNIKRDYKGVEPLIRTIEQRLKEEESRGRVKVLMREAETILAAENWTLAIEKLEAIRKLDPSNAEVGAKLGQARQGLEATNLYNRAQTHFAASRFTEALNDLKQLRHQFGRYKDVEQRITQVQKYIPPPPAQVGGGFVSKMKVFSIGGCLGAIVVIGIVVFFIALAISANSGGGSSSSSYETTRPQQTQPQQTRQQPTYATKCVVSQIGWCPMAEQVLMGAPCTCRGNGETYNGIAE